MYAVTTCNVAGASVVHSGYTEALEIVSNVSSPTVTTQPCSSISTTTATGNGTIASLGSSAVTQHGHCWATAINPTTADSKTQNGAGALGSFTSAITGLTQGLTYFVRAYATNSAGTSYGENVSFIAGNPSVGGLVSGYGGQIFMLGDTTYKYDGDGVLQEFFSATDKAAHEADPTGGAVVDTEARATIVSLLAKLETLGILKTV